ncbi:hypothetical protein AYI69_g2593, partial [Smittium culicis]
MSQDGTNIQDTTPAPEWAMEILRRIAHLEAQNTPMPENSEDSVDVDVDVDVDGDNYIVDKLPLRDLQLYPELTNALPGISQDFFKSPITDSERKKFFGCCPRNTGMIYDPPSLNEMGLSSEFKKEDSKLQDIQYRISGLTRPIDYFVHNLLQGQNRLNTAKTIEFAGLMRILLSDLASQVTQIRMDNAYKASKIPGKAPQILPSTAKPLFEPKEFVKHITASQALSKAVFATKPRNRKGFNTRKWGKKTSGYQNQQEQTQEYHPVQHKPESQTNGNGYNGNSRSRPFVQRGRGKNSDYTGGFPDPSSDPTTDGSQKCTKVETNSVKPREPGRNRERNNGPPSKKGHRRNFSSEARIFLKNVHRSQEIRRTSTSAQSKTVKPIPTADSFQNGELKHRLQINKEKGLDDEHRPIGRFPTCPDTKILPEITKLQLEISKLSIPGPTIWDITEPFSIHKDSSPGFKMGKTERNPNKFLFRRPNNSSLFKRGIYSVHESGVEKIEETGIPYKHGEVEHESFSVNSPPRDENKLTSKEPRDTKGKRKAQAMAVALLPERLELNSGIDKPGFGKSNLVERQSTGLKWKVISTRDPGGRNIHRRERLELGDCSGEHALLRSLETTTDFTGNKCERTVSHSLYIEASRDTGKECVSTLRQKDLNSICEEARGDSITKPSESIGGSMATLYIYGDETPTELCSVDIEPGGCSFETDCSNRMVIVKKCLQQDREEHATSKFRQLEAESGSFNGKCIQPCMEDMEAAILLSSLEFNTANNPKISSRKDDNYTGNSWMEDGGMVSRYFENVSTGS